MADQTPGEHEPLCRYRQALQEIAANDLPCVKCGERHVERPACNNPVHGTTWAARDGHAQRLMTPATYALRVLEEAAEFGSSTPPPVIL